MIRLASMPIRRTVLTSKATARIAIPAGAVQQPEDRQQQQDGDQRHNPRHVGNDDAAEGRVWLKSQVRRRARAAAKQYVKQVLEKKLTPMAVISMEIFEA